MMEFHTISNVSIGELDIDDLFLHSHCLHVGFSKDHQLEMVSGTNENIPIVMSTLEHTLVQTFW